MNNVIRIARRLVQSSRMETNAFFLWAAVITGAAAGFLFWNLSAHFYSTSDVGLASAVISMALLLSGIASLGIGIGIVRYLSNAENRPEMISTTLSFSCLTSLLIGTVCVAGIKIISPGLQSLQQPWFFFIFLLLLVATTHNIILQMVFLSLKRTSATFGMAILLNVLRLAILFFFRIERAQGIVAALVVATIISNLSALLILPRLLPDFRLTVALSGRILHQLIPYSFANSVADLLNGIPALLAPLLALGYLGAPASAPVYLAWMMGAMMLSPSAALAQSAFSEGASKPHKLRIILLKSGLYSLLITIILATIGFLLSDWILGLFGPDYRGAVIILHWLCVAAPVSALDSLFTAAFRVQKRLRAMIVINSIVLVLFMGSQIILLKTVGLPIMGTMWMATQCVAVVLSLVVLLRKKPEEISGDVRVERMSEFGVMN
jgi:O-antigen/teichoic acid export membrane protein